MRRVASLLCGVPLPGSTITLGSPRAGAMNRASRALPPDVCEAPPRPEVAMSRLGYALVRLCPQYQQIVSRSDSINSHRGLAVRCEARLRLAVGSLFTVGLRPWFGLCPLRVIKERVRFLLFD